MRWFHCRNDDIEAENRRAAEELRVVRAQWPAVQRAVEGLAARRERNHIAESIAAIYQGRRA
jgi:hypothetical protein